MNTYMSGDSGGEVSILRGDIMGFCKENSSYEHVCNSA
jgi:hypothetical protein